MSDRTKFDVAVVGAGPVGSVAALAFARKGARVVMLEADPRACRRFAGEWIHPAGVRVLDEVRAGHLDGASPRTGYGFVIVPDDGEGPIEMAYENGVAIAAEHGDIVEELRAAALSHPNITLRENARVVGIDGHVVRCEERRQGRALDVEAGRIVGADGRSSVVRQSLGIEDHGTLLSYMACVELHGVKLPREGFGHVVLGGPGPMLLYRIGDDRVRGCLDVPIEHGARSRSPGYLWEAFSPIFPPDMRESFRAALSAGPLAWAANRFRPRTHFGKGHVVLIGDAVGHTHPMTALGMTNGFQDALVVAETKSVKEYEARRRAHVPEVLSNALYHCFRRDDRSAESLRSAMMEVLRTDEGERRRTLSIMAAEDGQKRTFGSAFLRMARHAAVRAMKSSPRPAEVPDRLVELAGWMQWPAAGLVPQRLLPRSLRARVTATRPLLGLGLGSPTPPKNDERRTSADVEPSPAIERASDRLLADLEALARLYGTAPDHELALPAVRRVRAIAASPMRAGMAARMTLAWRRLAREGVPRLLGLTPGTAKDGWTLIDLSELVLLLAERDESAGVREPIVGLVEATRAILSCATASGSLAVRPGAAPSLLATETGTVALAALLDARGADLPADLAARARAAIDAADAYVRTLELGDGAFTAPGGEHPIDAARYAIGVLVAAGAQPADPALRRACRHLATRQLGDGGFGSHERTATVLRALLAAHVAMPDVMSAAVRSLSEAVLGGAYEPQPSAAGTEEVPAPILHDALAADWLVHALHALGAFAAARAERPAARQKMAKPEPAVVTAALLSETLPAAPTPRLTARGGVEIAPADWEFCKKALAEVSRTFARPIALLPDRLEVAVTLGYLLCRIADTVEDHVAVGADVRDGLFADFLAVLEQDLEATTFERGMAKIPGDDEELSLARRLSIVMRVYDAQDAHTRAATVRWVTEMTRGMALYSHRPKGEDGIVALHTTTDLERYCYYVAGTVGHFLTDLFLAELGGRASAERALALREDAEDFAAGLQLVNILKDVTDDRARAWSFIPRTACAHQGIGVVDLVDPAQRAAAHAAVAPLFDVARRKLEGALRYTLSIPPEEHGIRLFCLLPLWMAARTLVLARGNDAMFVAGMPVKISREEVESIVKECITHAGDDAWIRARWATVWAHEQAPLAMHA